MASSPTKAYVLPIAGYEITLETLKKLILAGGCDIFCPDDPADAYERCVEGADVLVILICPETENSEAVDRVIAFAKKLGKRVVGVWASDAQPDKLPRFLHRHGSGTVGLNPDRIAAAVCGGQPLWDSPGGGPRRKPPTPRHKGH
jgi:hypothetical protein